MDLEEACRLRRELAKDKDSAQVPGTLRTLQVAGPVYG